MILYDTLYHCNELTQAYELDKGVKVYLAYKWDGDSEEKRRIYVCGNRFYQLEYLVSKGGVYLVIFDPNSKTNIIEELVFTEKNTAKLSVLLDKHHIAWKPAAKRDWHLCKTCATWATFIWQAIYFYRNGFYFYEKSGTDFNVSEDGIIAFIENGPVRDNSVLRMFKIMGSPFVSSFKVDKRVIKRVEEILDAGCTIEEYEAFINEQKPLYNTDEYYLEELENRNL